MKNMYIDELISFGSSLTFTKTGKNEYSVANKQGTNVGITTGQSRYAYLRCFGLLKFHKK